MQITDVRTVLLTGPCTNDRFLREARERRSAAFIEIHTDTGLTGWGETMVGYAFPEAVPGIVDFFAPVLIGQPVDDIPELWRRMYHCGNFWCRVGMGISVLTGIEAALWDLKGKHLGVPVHQLLGGLKHDRLLAYATGGPSNYPLEKLAAKVEYYLSLGFQGFKLGAGSHSAEEGFSVAGEPAAAADFEAAKLDFIRSRFGRRVEVMLDGHMGNSPGNTWNLEVAAAVMKAVEPYGLFFFEEPLPYLDAASYAALCKLTPIPIAGGECLTGFCEWKTYLDIDAFDIGQPDASYSGGFGEFQRIAAMLHERGRGLATHCWGAGGALMQNVHCAFSVPNTRILEIPPDYAGLHSEVVGDSFVMKDGYVLPPETPGLGIVLTDEIKNRYPFQPGSGEFNSVPGKILEEEKRFKHRPGQP